MRHLLAPRPLSALRLVACLVTVLLTAAPQSAFAQNPIADFFNGLFNGGRHYERPAFQPRERRDAYRARRYMPHSASRPQSISRYPAPSSHIARTPHPPASEPATQTDEKPPGTETFFVAVMGDTLAQLLTQGLETAFEETPQIGFRHKSKESSGLIRDDYFDWVKAARAIAAEQPKPDVAVMMIGANDRQALTLGAETAEPLSPRWREAYAARIEAIVAAFKEKGIPVVLVGLPVMKNEKFSADIEQINEIERNEAGKTEAAFVDIWDKFADEHGQYSAFGPDVNGEIVKLRSADGVHFTDAGARKLAHFVEGEIKRLYDARGQAQPAPPVANDAAPPPTLPPAPPAAHITYRPPGQEPPAAAPSLPKERPAIGPVQQLTTPAASADDLAGKGNLVKRAGADASVERALAKHVFIEGGEQPSRHGRADDFSLSPKPPPVPVPQ
jgi:uncharacterized protein